MLYYSTGKEKDAQSKTVINLLLATAKPVNEPRINCFEVTSSKDGLKLMLVCLHSVLCNAFCFLFISRSVCSLL